MRFRDLPRYGIVKKSLNRKIYEFFWTPFQFLIDIFSGFVKFLPVGLAVAIAGWLVVIVFMFLMDGLTMKVAAGIGILAALAGFSLSALMAVVRAFR